MEVSEGFAWERDRGYFQGVKGFSKKDIKGRLKREEKRDSQMWKKKSRERKKKWRRFKRELEEDDVIQI